MQYFNHNFLKFLTELPENNNKEWFLDNKENYKIYVELPFKQFISDFIEELQPFIPNLNVTAKDCIFRIYKDVRFSKDKTPYKTHVSALINSNGKKNKTTPGIYIEFSRENIKLYSGCFQLSSNQKEQVRNHISENLREFNSLVNASDFVNKFGTIKGEKHKKIPTKYQVDSIEQPLLFNKSFYYFTKYSSDFALNDNLIEILLHDFKATIRLNSFFREALK